MAVDYCIDQVFEGGQVGYTLDIFTVFGSLHLTPYPERDRLKEPRDCKICKFQPCKTADIVSEHEFLLATVNHPANPDHPRILRIERNSNPIIDVNITKDTIGYYEKEDTALNFQSEGAHISQTLVLTEGENPNARSGVCNETFCFLHPKRGSITPLS